MVVPCGTVCIVVLNFVILVNQIMIADLHSLQDVDGRTADNASNSHIIVGP